MQNRYRIPQPNMYNVDPAHNWQMGFLADGKILYCENYCFL